MEFWESGLLPLTANDEMTWRDRFDTWLPAPTRLAPWALLCALLKLLAFPLAMELMRLWAIFDCLARLFQPESAVELANWEPAMEEYFPPAWDPAALEPAALLNVDCMLLGFLDKVDTS